MVRRAGSSFHAPLPILPRTDSHLASRSDLYPDRRVHSNRDFPLIGLPEYRTLQVSVRDFLSICL